MSGVGGKVEERNRKGGIYVSMYEMAPFQVLSCRGLRHS